MKNSRLLPLVPAFVLALPGPASGLEHGSFEVIQNNDTNDNHASANPAVTLTVKPGSTANFAARGHNKGDIDMAFSATPAEDPLNGVMLTAVTQNTRNNGYGGGVDGISHATSAAEINATGFYIPIHATGGSAEASGSEFNIDVAAAWFPYAEGWLGGQARNAANGGPLTILNASPGIRLGTGFIDEPQGGICTVDLRGFTTFGVEAVPANGVMLTVGGRNEDNFSLARSNADGTFTLSVMDNGVAGPTSYEQDGVAFAYVPAAAAGVGRVKAVGRIQSGGHAEIRGGGFSVSHIGAGEWLLQIDGATDATGTLIVSAEGGLPPAETMPNNTNNFVTYEWSSSLGGWVVHSRDLPSAALQDGATDDEPMFSFVFLTEHPALALDAPAAGTLVQVGDQLVFRASATAETAPDIGTVQFFVNGELVGSDSAEPYEFTHTVPLPGYLHVEARATSAGGIVSGSEIARVIAEAPVGAPAIPGYSVAIIDGGDGEADAVPPAEVAQWQVLAGTPEPRAFTDPGTQPGEPAIRINGSPVPFASGILISSNYAGNDFADATTRGSIDNHVIPRLDGGAYALAVEDNAQGGGDPATRKESARFALGFFPFADGWVGANVGADLSIIGGSSNLPPGIKMRNPSVGSYEIEGLPMDGNLLAISIGEGSDNVATVGQNGIHWLVNSRDNSQELENDAFGFLFVPRSSTQVLSGRVIANGSLTPLNAGLEAMGATVSLVANTYEIQFGDGTVVNPSTAALFVTGDFQAGNGFDNIYSYHANGNKFVVFSQDLPGLPGNPQTGGFRFLAVPLAPQELKGDEVELTVTKDLATEGTSSRTLEFRFTRTGNTGVPLTIHYEIDGTATNGTDYHFLSGTLDFAAGSATSDLIVTAADDEEFELDETVALTLLPGAGYSVGLSATASGTIRNAASLVPVVTVSFQEGIDGYTGQFSKFVGKRVPRTVVDGADVFGEPVYTDVPGSAVSAAYLDGYPGHKAANPADDSPDINGIVRFDNLFGNGPGQIPPGAAIAKAELLLTTANGANSRSNGPFVVDRLMVPVDASTTYADLDAGPGFEGVRGSSSGMPVSAFGILLNNQVERGDITSIVRAWAEDPSGNHGFAIYTTQVTDGWEYHTEGNADPTKRPKLVVSYVEAETQTYTFGADVAARLLGDGPTEDGAATGQAFIDQITGATQEALMRFPVTFGSGEGDIPPDEEIVRAEILLTTSGTLLGGSGNAHSPGPIAVHRVLVPWDVTTTFGYYGPVVGGHLDPAISRAFGMGQGSTAYFDITGVVQAWRAGQPNHGVNIKPETTDGWQFFWPGTPYAEAAPQLRIVTAKRGATEQTPFQQWAVARGAAGAAMASDADGDGIPMILEYALGLDPLAVDSLPAIHSAADAGSLRFAKGSAAAADAAVGYLIQSSSDLVNWIHETPAVNSAAEIAVEFLPGSGTKFFRLAVTYQP